MYIEKSIKYKLQKDLHMYKSKQLESTFIEVFYNNKKSSLDVYTGIHLRNSPNLITTTSQIS